MNAESFALKEFGGTLARPRTGILGAILAITILVAAPYCLVPTLCAQDPGSTVNEQASPPDTGDVQTMFPHPPDAKYWISGQANFIYQTNPPFYAQYSGPHSFLPIYEKATSRLLTLYTGYQLTHSIEVLVDVEEAGGEGLSQALGLAGFTNLDVVRNPSLSQAPYLSRYMYHQVFALSSEKTENARGPLSTFAELPKRRLEFRFGKYPSTISSTSTQWVAIVTCNS